MSQWKSELYQSLIGTSLEPWLSTLQAQLDEWENQTGHANKKMWEQQSKRLPHIDELEFIPNDTVSLSKEHAFTEQQSEHLTQVLKQFMPWRKGPFNFFGINIDTEWRSDWKWQRVLPHISSLKDKQVLDVGCGSGYHLFRMHEQGAKQIIGIDPTMLFFYQFHIFKRYLPSLNIHYAPLGIEQMPVLKGFDTVFSMGVLYHRKDPIKFLTELKDQLKPGGELVLETLVITGDENQVLMPSERYAQMRNVWFIPSTQALALWLKRVGFKNIKTVDVSLTSIEEQRATDWMDNHSLANFLDPLDNTKTIEGYPAPLRATLVANI